MRYAAAVVSLVLVVGSASRSTGQPLTLGEGQTIFMENCHRCHALGEGEAGRIAPPIGTVDLYGFVSGLWNQSHAMFREFSVRGWRPPALDRTELQQVFLFTQIVAERPAAGDAGRGARFVERNRCLVCHRIGGRGASDGVSWDRYARTLHAGAVMSAVWLHRRTMTEAFRAKGLPLPRFRRGDLADLVAFLRATGRPRVAAPILMDLQELAVDPALFRRFRCQQCHRVEELAGRPDRTHQAITEELLAHAFFDEYERPPLSRISMLPAESMSLAALVSYYGHLDRPGSTSRGRRVFRQQNCIGCHDLPDRPEPESAKKLIGAVRDEWDFASRIFNKVPLMIETARLESRAFPRLTAEELRDLFAYLCESSPGCTPVVGRPRP